VQIGSSDRSPLRLAVAVTAVLVGLSPVPAGIAYADGPDPPAPTPASTPSPAATGSTPDELGDMVLDVIESGGGPTVPTTTAAQAPHGR
jgi:hypothetical protein